MTTFIQYTACIERQTANRSCKLLIMGRRLSFQIDSTAALADDTEPFSVGKQCERYQWTGCEKGYACLCRTLRYINVYLYEFRQYSPGSWPWSVTEVRVTAALNDWSPTPVQQDRLVASAGVHVSSVLNRVTLTQPLMERDHLFYFADRRANSLTLSLSHFLCVKLELVASDRLQLVT